MYGWWKQQVVCAKACTNMQHSVIDNLNCMGMPSILQASALYIAIHAVTHIMKQSHVDTSATGKLAARRLI